MGTAFYYLMKPNLLYVQKKAPQFYPQVVCDYKTQHTVR